MNTIGAVVVGVSALMVATVASAQVKTPDNPNLGQSTMAQSGPAGTESGVPPSPPLFMIGGLSVHLSASVEPVHNANSNGNPSADVSLWEAQETEPQPGF